MNFRPNSQIKYEEPPQQKAPKLDASPNTTTKKGHQHTITTNLNNEEKMEHIKKDMVDAFLYVKANGSSTLGTLEVIQQEENKNITIIVDDLDHRHQTLIPTDSTTTSESPAQTTRCLWTPPKEGTSTPTTSPTTSPIPTICALSPRTLK